MFSREELESFTLKQLRLIDIKEVEDEALVQELINKKMSTDGKGDFSAANIDRSDIGDIQTPEQEAEAQKKIDERVAAVKQKREASINPTVAQNPPQEEVAPSNDVTLTPVNEAVDANVPMMDITLTKEDLDLNPELVEQGLKVGDVVQIPEAEPAPEAPEPVKEDPAVKCKACGSKSARHKKGCPKAKK